MVFSTISPKEAELEMLHAIRRSLADDQRVLWLVSGGSCIAAEVALLQRLTDEEVRRLAVMLADERYGTPGHVDSNHAKLIAAGFSRSELDFPDILEAGSPEGVLAKYEAYLHREMDTAGVVVATLGVGADGHTAGILPGSKAVDVEGEFAVKYEAPDFTRITAGLGTLRRIDVASVFAYGEAKREALERLAAHREPLASLPAAILYDIPSVTIYNDFIERGDMS